jgi:MFS family permease
MADSSDGAKAEAANRGGPQRITFVTVLRNDNFRRLWVGQVVSQIGDYFAFLAMLVVVSDISAGSVDLSTAVSGMMISLTLPRLLFGALAGVFVDRWDRRRAMLLSDLLRMVLTLAMIPAFRAGNLALMYGLAFAMSAVGTVFNPAKNAIIADLIPKEHLLSANSLSQASAMLTKLAGPALAGATFAAVGQGNQWIAFVINSASFLASAVAIWLLPVPRRPLGPAQGSAAPAERPLRRIFQELMVGLRMLALNRVISVISAVAAITLIGMGVMNVLWIVFLKTSFGFEGNELAWRCSIMDITLFTGMAISSVMAGNFFPHLAPKRLIVGGLFLMGGASVLVGYLPTYWLVATAMFFVGLFMAPVHAGINTLVLLVVPNDRLGRVTGGMSTVMDTALLGAMSVAGLLGRVMAVSSVFLLCGLLCAIGAAVAWLRLPLSVREVAGMSHAREDSWDLAHHGRRRS